MTQHQQADLTQWFKEEFGHSICFRVTDPQLRDAFSSTVNNLFGVNNLSGGSNQRFNDRNSGHNAPRGNRATTGEPRFPGPVPCSIMRADLDLLRNKHYVVFEKTDGTRYLLLCTRLSNVDFCVLIDRHWTARIVNFKFDPAVYERNTLFDGELVQKNTGSWHFLIFDLTSSGQVSTRQNNYVLRMKAAEQILRNEYHPNNQTPFALQVKRYEKMEDFERLRNADQEYNGFATDGYLFMPVNNYVTPFRNRETLKWKSKHTIDFELRYKTGVGLEYWIKDERDVPKYFSTVPPVRNSVGHSAEQMQHDYVIGSCIERVRSGERIIVECLFDNPTSAWLVVKERNDRQGANAEYTIERTLENVRENITKEELFNVVNNERVSRSSRTTTTPSHHEPRSRFRTQPYGSESNTTQRPHAHAHAQYNTGNSNSTVHSEPRTQHSHFQPLPQILEHCKPHPYYMNYCLDGTEFPLPPNAQQFPTIQPPINTNDSQNTFYSQNSYSTATNAYTLPTQSQFPVTEHQVNATNLLNSISSDLRFLNDPDYADPPAHFLPTRDNESAKNTMPNNAFAQYDPLRPGYSSHPQQEFRPILIDDQNNVPAEHTVMNGDSLQQALEQLSNALKKDSNGILAKTLLKT